MSVANDWLVPPFNPRQTFGFLAVNASGTNSYLKFCTFWADSLYDQLSLFPDEMRVPLNLHQLGRSPKEARPRFPLEVLSTVEALRSLDVPVFDAGGVAEMEHLATKYVVVYPTPGRPAEPNVVAHRSSSLYSALPISSPAVSWACGSVSGHQIHGLRGRVAGENWHMDPQVADIGGMTTAQPFEDVRLRDYQKEAVGLHLETDFGYVNALEPGMGKTICSLVAMGDRASRVDRYRGLVVCEANVRDQWFREAKAWLPGFDIFVVSSGSDAERLKETLSSQTKPLVVIVSYALSKSPEPEDDVSEGSVESTGSVEVNAAAETGGSSCEELNVSPQGALFDDAGVSWDTILIGLEDDESSPTEKKVTVGELLLQSTWHDLIADEAALLKNPGTRQSRSLWRLRQ
ncbi:MAG: SNF2-related protein, partial [Maioricimonas sp. JB049]